jgi:hypothetical protein
MPDNKTIRYFGLSLQILFFNNMRVDFSCRNFKNISRFFSQIMLAGQDQGEATDPADPNAGRFVRYHFTPEFLKLRKVGATVEFRFCQLDIHSFKEIGYVLSIECSFI